MKMTFVLSLLGAGLLIQFAFADDGRNEPQRLAISVEQKYSVKNYSHLFNAVGTVRMVDTENGIVTIFHAPIAELMWPSMTMPFAVEDKILLNKIKVGEKIEFKFVRDSKNGVIVAIK